MKLFQGLRARKALLKHQRGDVAGARADYEALLAEDCLLASYILPYSVMLLRDGGEDNFNKVKDILRKAQKAPDLVPERKSQLLMNFAVADYKLGNAEKAISLMEASHRENANGLTYETLGYLYVDTGDVENALAFNEKALEYDDESAVTLDNLGQLHYRILGDKEKARPYFERAHVSKPGQIDTLYFLSFYDEEEGKLDQAIERLEKALEGRFSPLNYAQEALVRQRLADLEAKRGEQTEKGQ